MSKLWLLMLIASGALLLVGMQLENGFVFVGAVVLCVFASIKMYPAQ